MSGKDQSVVSKEALMTTKPGKQIIKQGLFKSKGYKLFKNTKKKLKMNFQILQKDLPMIYYEKLKQTLLQILHKRNLVKK